MGEPRSESAFVHRRPERFEVTLNAPDRRAFAPHPIEGEVALGELLGRVGRFEGGRFSLEGGLFDEDLIHRPLALIKLILFPAVFLEEGPRVGHAGGQREERVDLAFDLLVFGAQIDEQVKEGVGGLVFLRPGIDAGAQRLGLARGGVRFGLGAGMIGGEVSDIARGWRRGGAAGRSVDLGAEIFKTSGRAEEIFELFFHRGKVARFFLKGGTTGTSGVKVGSADFGEQGGGFGLDLLKAFFLGGDVDVARGNFQLPISPAMPHEDTAAGIESEGLTGGKGMAHGLGDSGTRLEVNGLDSPKDDLERSRLEPGAEPVPFLFERFERLDLGGLDDGGRCLFPAAPLQRGD